MLITTTSFAMRQAIQIKGVNNLNALYKVEQVDNNYLFIDESYSPSAATISEWNWSIYSSGTLLKQYQTQSINTSFTEPGDYQVVLKVKDTSGNWSLPYEQTITHKVITTQYDDLDPFRFHLAQYSDEQFQDGYRSILVEPTSQNFYLQDILLKGQVTLDFAIKAPGMEDVQLTLIGYTAGRETMRQSFTIPAVRSWSPQSIAFASDAIDKLEFQFENLTGPTYLDSFNIHSNQ